MHAGFGAQETIGVFAFNLEGGALDAGDFTFGLFDHFDLEILAFAVAQVHAFQHGSPVLGLGAAGAGLDVDKTAVRVHGVGEHAAEFQRLELGFDTGKIVPYGQNGIVVVFGAPHVEQFAAVGEGGEDAVDDQHDVFQYLFLTAEFLGALGVFPDGRIFDQAADFLQAILLAVIVEVLTDVRSAAAKVGELVVDLVENFGFEHGEGVNVWVGKRASIPKAACLRKTPNISVCLYIGKDGPKQSAPRLAARRGGADGQPSRWATPWRSSSSSASVLFMQVRLNSSISRPWTISYLPSLQVTGKP